MNSQVMTHSEALIFRNENLIPKRHQVHYQAGNMMNSMSASY